MRTSFFTSKLPTERRVTSFSDSTPDKFECISRRRSAWCTKAELSDRADSETPRRLPHANYVLHRAGCAQADDQLLREGWQWRDSRGRHDSGYTFRSGPLDESASAAVDRGDGSHCFYRLDLRSLTATCGGTEGRASVDAAGHCSGEKEERSYRREQDLRLL